MPPYTLKELANAGYILGLGTIGEVANHMRSHYDAYFLIEALPQQLDEFEEMIASHNDSSIDLWLTDDDKRKLDEELDKVMADGPEPFSVKDD